MPVYTVVFDTSVLQVLFIDCDTANTGSAFSVSLISGGRGCALNHTDSEAST